LQERQSDKSRGYRRMEPFSIEVNHGKKKRGNEDFDLFSQF
jgi:hypothetical protein